MLQLLLNCSRHFHLSTCTLYYTNLNLINFIGPWKKKTKSRQHWSSSGCVPQSRRRSSTALSSLFTLYSLQYKPNYKALILKSALGNCVSLPLLLLLLNRSSRVWMSLPGEAAGSSLQNDAAPRLQWPHQKTRPRRNRRRRSRMR